VTATFNDYREIAAKHPGVATDCGTVSGQTEVHRIEVGDRIGYIRTGKRRPGRTICAGCWDTWKQENASERFELDENRCSYANCNVPATRRTTVGGLDGYTCGNHSSDKPRRKEAATPNAT